MTSPADAHKARALAALARFEARTEQARLGTTDRGLEKLQAKRDREARPKRQRDPDAAPTEYQEQRQVVQWLRANGLVYAANLEGVYLRGDAARWGALVAIGARRGRPDLEVFTPPPLHPTAKGVALEMKSTRRGANPSPDQIRFLLTLSEFGWVTYVAHGAADAVEWLRSLGYGQEGCQNHKREG